ncbi:MAG: substrate-binding domain-containing protein [Stellaceae bacterium]
MTMRARCWAVVALVGLMAPSDAGAETVVLYAAGSLRGALSDIIAAYAAAYGDTVQPKFGASGLLKDEIASGAKAEVFASANMGHPQALARANRAGPVVLFARNRLCALARPGLVVEPTTLLDPHARLRGQAWHLDAASRPFRGLRMGGVSQCRGR